MTCVYSFIQIFGIEPAGWRIVVKCIAVGVGGLGLSSGPVKSDKIVANGWPPLRFFIAAAAVLSRR